MDQFIVARLENEALSPSEIANKETLIRRVTLDLTGLPPTTEEVDAFLADESPEAYEKLVDRLLASPRYGERMALVWLDAARYADSGGYQNDIYRTQWPWRDWVIDAYNANMPFDQFTIEQLAGDLLEDPTPEQKLATAFNRNHRINNEGGIIPKEFLVEYVADRVETTSTVWLGLTMACARCHDHKYDPLSQKDFFQFYAFFNNINENGKDGAVAPVPNMDTYHGSTSKEHQQIKHALASVKNEMRDFLDSSEDDFSKWLSSFENQQRENLDTLSVIGKPAIHFPFESAEKQLTPNVANPNKKGRLSNRSKRYQFLVDTEYGKALAFDKSTFASLSAPHQAGFSTATPRTWTLRFQSPKNFSGSDRPLLAYVYEESDKGYRLLLEDEGDRHHYRASFKIIYDSSQQQYIEVVSKSAIERKAWAQLAVVWDGSGKASGVKLYLNGQPLETETLSDTMSENFNYEGTLFIGARSAKDARETLRDATFADGLIEDVQIYDKDLDAAQIAFLHQIDSKLPLAANANKPSREALKIHWFKETPEAQRLANLQKKRENELSAFEEKHVVKVSVMEEMDTPRPTYLLSRGAYEQPDKSEELDPRVPAALPQMSPDLPQNRLGLAKWLVEPKNPLTARVTINRYWQMYFGNGLVETPEDFGSQGKLPTHPKLLDYLANEFIASGWDVKAMQKRIVMSSTYRQSSKVTPQLLEKDPKNKLLARGPRFRLYGQALRDQALAVSGLMADTIGGPPVMPYQPEGLWEEVEAKGYKYKVGAGDDLYRRSLYTFWRRTVPPPSMMNFDNSAREVCSVRHSSTNTPLQALNLMNDPQYVEAARLLGQRMLLEGGDTPAEQIAFGYKAVLARPPKTNTLQLLEKSFGEYQDYYRGSPERTKSLTSIGAAPADPSLQLHDLAAMTMVANVLLNLDETVTKQ
ncbi:MAG: DUF1553 domain-containing protein [Verrucomicrobiota bacterium]